MLPRVPCGKLSGMNDRGRLLALILTLLLGVLGTANPAHAQTGVVKGTVTSQATGLPVGGVAVVLHQAGGAAARTTCSNPDGTWALTGVATGMYDVLFDTSDWTSCLSNTTYATEWWDSRSVRIHGTPIAVVDGAETTGIDASLVGESAILGTVTDAVTGAAAQHISVKVYDHLGQLLGTRCSGADGTYRIGNLTGGVFMVGFVADRVCGASAAYATQYFRNSPTMAGATAVNLGPNEEQSAVDAGLRLAPVDPGNGDGGGDGGGGNNNGGGGSNNGGGGGNNAGGGGTGTPAPPVVAPPTGIPSAPTPACKLAPSSKVKRGKLTVVITCDRPAELSLGGTVSFKQGKRTTAVRLKTGSYTTTKRTVTLTLPARAKTALRKRLRLSAAFTLTVTGGTPATVTATVKRLK